MNNSVSVEPSALPSGGATRNPPGITNRYAGNPEGDAFDTSFTTESGHAEQTRIRLASIIESCNDSIVSMDLNGIIRSWNQGSEHLFGYSSAETIGKPITILTPRDCQNKEATILARVGRGEYLEPHETALQHKGGSLLDISLTVSPVKDAKGRIVGASIIAQDISSRKRAEEHKDLLFQEMSHRITNLFAVVSSLVTSSIRTDRTPDEMIRSLQGRMGALTRAYKLTCPRPGGEMNVNQGVSLHVLVKSIFLPYADPQTDERVSIEGPDVSISGDAVRGLGLVLHELTTNAVKYGALLSATGRVRIECLARNDDLLLTWIEEGGPALSGRPEHEGFGSALVRQTITRQFGGQFSADWSRTGLTARIAIPIGRLTA